MTSDFMARIWRLEEMTRFARKRLDQEADMLAWIQQDMLMHRMVIYGSGNNAAPGRVIGPPHNCTPCFIPDDTLSFSFPGVSSAFGSATAVSGSLFPFNNNPRFPGGFSWQSDILTGTFTVTSPAQSYSLCRFWLTCVDTNGNRSSIYAACADDPSYLTLPLENPPTHFNIHWTDLTFNSVITASSTCSPLNLVFQVSPLFNVTYP